MVMIAGLNKDGTRGASHGKSPRGRVCTAWSCGKSTNEAALCTWRVRCGRRRRTNAAPLCAFCDLPGNCAARGRRDWYY
jgi:hypothetical protein